MTAGFQSERWHRPFVLRTPGESWHVHGHAIDIPAFPIGPLRVKSGYRTVEEQRELLRQYGQRPPIMVTSPSWRLVAPWVPMPDAPLALWGGRKGSIQFGSPLDRTREAWRRSVAWAAQLGRHHMHLHVSMKRKGHLSPAMAGLLDMGRQLDLIWA